MFVPRWHDPDRKQRPPIAEATAEIAAPPERVAAALFAIQPQQGFLGSLPMLLRAPHVVPRTRLGTIYDLSGGPEHFTLFPQPPAAGRLTHFDIDLAAAAAAIHGGWWFRREFAVAGGSFPGFARLTCKVFNVAPGLTRRMLPLAFPRVDHAARAAETLNALVAMLGREVGIVAVPAAS